jgi:hypothetical protein
MKGGVGSVPATPPEYAGQYPDPNLWGQLPAYGVFVRHADGVSFTRTTIDPASADSRTQLRAIDVLDLAPPSCDVTFVVHTAREAPAFDDTIDTMHVLGRTAPPPGVDALGGADALGAWKAASGGILTRADASTFTGHASVPQGAPIEFKAVVMDGAAVAYERNHLGNRTATIPYAATATVDLTWQN